MMTWLSLVNDIMLNLVLDGILSIKELICFVG